MIQISDITDLRNVTFCRYETYLPAQYEYRPEFQEIAPGRWVDLPLSKEISYGDLKEEVPSKDVLYILEDQPDTDLFMLVDYCTGSDYSGDTVELSNYNVFLENYGEYPGVYDVHGGFSTRSIAVSLRWLLNPENEESAQSIIDTINALSDYPLIDDEALSSLESDLEYEYITEDWYRWELPSEFSKQHGIDIQYDECTIVQIWGLYRMLSERANEYPVFEDNGWPYIRTEEIVKAYKVGDLTDLEIPHTLSDDLSDEVE